MHPFISAKFLAGATLAFAAFGAATVAEARPEVYLSIGIQGGPARVEQGWGYAQPRPVYVQPQTVYVQPQPVYVQPQPRYVQPPVFDARPPVFVVPRESFERPRWGGDDRRDAWERHRAWRHAEWMRHERDDRFRGGNRDHDDNGHHHRDRRD